MEKLFMMDFPAEEVRIKKCFRDEARLGEIAKTSPEQVTIDKIKDVYGDLQFPPAPADRPYTFCSVVLSADGKMAFHNRSAGPLIAKENYFDPDGALADFWMLNALRVYSDGVILGANTLQHEADNTSHVFDQDMAKQRVKQLGKSAHPMNIVVSFDATDIPFDHLIFNIDEDEELPVAIATSPQGGEYIKTNFKKKTCVFGPYISKEEVDEDALRVKKDLEATGALPVFLTGEENRPDAALLLYLLRKIGMMRLLIESPSYNWHLMEEGMLDEYFINYSMVYAGGDISPGGNRGFDHDDHPHARLLAMGTHHSSFIFTRQKLYYGVKSQQDLSKYKY